MTTAASDAAVSRGIQRDAASWYAYLLLAYFTYLVSIQGNIIPYLQADLGLSYGQVSLHTSAIASGTVIVGLFGDRLARRLGRKTTLVFSALGAALGALLLCLAPAVWASVAACLIIGLSGAFIPAMVPAILGDIHGEEYRETAYAESNALCYAFAIVAPLVVALAAAMNWNWRVGMILGAVTGVAITFAYRSTQFPKRGGAETGKGAPLPRAFWAYLTMLAFAVALEFAALLWAPVYFERVIGLSPSTAAAAAGVFFAAMLIGRTGGVPLFRLMSLRTLFFASMATVVVGAIAYWATAIAAVAIVGLAIIGLGISNLFALITSFAMESSGASNRASTRMMAAPGLALLLSPPLLGVIADHAGLRTAQLMIPVFVACALAAYGAAKLLEKRT